MPLPDITPLHVGASGYFAQVCRSLKIAPMVNRLVQWDEKQWKRSPGTLAVAMIINILTHRKPLYRVWEAYEHLDLPVLFDEPVAIEDLNDDALGRTLDRLHSSGNLKLLVHSVALGAVHQLPLGIRSVHADTTSIALAGEYDWTASDEAFQAENPDRRLLRITHGYSKDRRPDLKQFVYGLVVSGEGLPLMADVRDGNTSDKLWNGDVIDEIQRSFLDPKTIVYVADSALVTPENLARMNEHGIRFISRLPETYKLAAELKERAWAQDRWECLGRLAQSAKGAVYHAQSFTEEFEGRPYRFIVVHSTAKNRRKSKTIEKQIARERTELTKAVKAFEKERFNCSEDAIKAYLAFEKHQSPAFHALSAEVIEERTLRRPPGRPPKGFVPEEIIRYGVRVTVTPPTTQKVEEALARGSTFVLITALDEQLWSNGEVLREYKGQTAVETRFRNLKSNPCIVDGFYVKSSRRAEALAYLFLLALIVASFVEIKIRQELKVRKEQFLVPGRRLTDRPTMAAILDIMSTILVVIVHDPGGVQRVLPSNTDPRVWQILELTGLDESAYTLVRRSDE